MIEPNERTLSRQAHVRGLLMLACALVAGVALAYWEARGATGYPNPASILAGTNARHESASVPHEGASLVASGSNVDQVLFGRYCDSCHPAGDEGIGASLRSAQFKQEYTTPDQIAKVVRSGGFDMPAFPSALLPDDSLQQITKYVLNLPPEGQ